MKKVRAEQLAKKHHQYYAGRREKLHVIPHYPAQTTDSYCILCSSEDNTPLHVFSSASDMESTIKYQKDNSKEKWW